MRKIALFAAFAVVTGATVVQAQATGGRAGGQRGMGMGRGMGAGGGMMMDQMLFKDITLTDAQKAKIKELREADRAKMEAERTQPKARAEMEALRDARQKGDTATARRLMREQRERMQTQRNEQLSDLRAILTDDQRKQFDANTAAMKEQMGERGMGRGMQRPPER